MRFGCTTAEASRLTQLAEMGFDFAELRGRALAPLGDDVTFSSILERIREAGIPVEAVSGIIPPYVSIPIVGPSVDRQRLLGHIQMVLDRAAAAGARLVVFGSGSARSAPAGFDRGRALAQLREFVAACADLCAARSMVFTLEFLNAEETNLVNSIGEAAALIKPLSKPNLGIALDCYHVLTGEDPSALSSEHMRLVRHVHTSDDGRRPPMGPGDHQAELMAALRAAGYDKRMTIEARFDDFNTEAPAALRRLRELWSAAGTT